MKVRDPGDRAGAGAPPPNARHLFDPVRFIEVEPSAYISPATIGALRI